jgi:succinate dehydrogenase/fumarate reductase flavoprotein subunit
MPEYLQLPEISIARQPSWWGLFYHSYAGGSGLMAGSVFGRIAGEHAAREAAGRRAEVDVPRRGQVAGV